jgi:nickel-dependent lactate racemase
MPGSHSQAGFSMGGRPILFFGILSMRASVSQNHIPCLH